MNVCGCSRFIDTNDKHGCVVQISLYTLVQDSNEIVVLWASTVLLSPLSLSLCLPVCLPPSNLGIGCSLQVHQVLYISHQLWSYLHFAAHLLSIQMACVKNK